jgi:hypothetical protein
MVSALSTFLSLECRSLSLSTTKFLIKFLHESLARENSWKAQPWKCFPFWQIQWRSETQ